MEKPTYFEWVAAKRVLRYLKGTLKFKIKYKKRETLNFALCSDADYAGGEDKKSTSGFIALVNDTPVA